MRPSQDIPSARADSDAGATPGGGDLPTVFWRLERLADVGRRIMAAIGVQLSALTGPGSLRRILELEAVFDRVGWAIRLIVALNLKLLDAKAVERRQTIKPLDGRPDPKDRPEAAEREGGDRFDFDRFGPILKRPVEDILAIISDALGATQEWWRWVEAACTCEGIEEDASAGEALICPRWSQRPQARRARSPALRRLVLAAPS